MTLRRQIEDLREASGDPDFGRYRDEQGRKSVAWYEIELTPEDIEINKLMSRRGTKR